MTAKRGNFTAGRSKQSGVILFVALILLVILSMIGVTLARMQTVEERMARNETSRQMAEQAAEAALRNAEDSLLNLDPNVFAADAGGYFYVDQTTGSATPSLLPGLDWTNAANYVRLYGAGDDEYAARDGATAQDRHRRAACGDTDGRSDGRYGRHERTVLPTCSGSPFRR